MVRHRISNVERGVAQRWTRAYAVASMLLWPPLLALALTIAAIAGKQVCSLGAGKGVDRLTVGIGMVPRGEVGLIFANIGQSLTIGGKPENLQESN